MSKEKRKAKIRNVILKTYASIVFFIWCFAACSVDSPSWTPTIVFLITTLLLAWFAWANSERYEHYGDDYDR